MRLIQGLEVPQIISQFIYATVLVLEASKWFDPNRHNLAVSDR